MIKKTIFPFVILTLASAACVLPESEKKNMENTAEKTNSFTSTRDGKTTELFTLKNSSGMEVSLTNYGATIVSIHTPDKNGKMADVILGYDSIQGYYNGGAFFGCAVGRYANRIAKAAFTLNGKTYKLAANNGPNSLHGGKFGFNKYVWDAKQNGNSVEFKMTSKDGDEGYPGTVNVTLTYTLTDSNELKLDYTASTDQATVINLSNHAYFNLGGIGSGTILNHKMQIFGDAITPVDSTLIPTGTYMKVKGTAFDFLEPHTLGERIDADEEQIKFGGGYDHNYVIKEKDDRELKKTAEVTEPVSGRVMTVFTTQPGVQLYCGNFLNGNEKGKGVTYGHRTGFCLETQHFPDSPNQPQFPPVVLQPGEKWESQTIYKFSVQK